MKHLFLLNGAVVSVIVVHQEGVIPGSTIAGTTEMTVPADSPVDVGYTYDATTGQFCAPAEVLPKLTPMTFYLSFTPAERIKIKASTDPEVMEFWDTYQRAERTDTMVDPNVVSVREGLAYLAQQPTDTQPGPGILASADRIPQILAGIPQ